MPGVTRDRHYGDGRLGARAFIAIDTGGFEPRAPTGIFVEMARQAEQAIAEADAVVFVVDGRAGLTPGDRDIAEQLRKLQHAGVARGQQGRGHAIRHRGGRVPRARPRRARARSRRRTARACASCSSSMLAKFPDGTTKAEDDDKGHPRVAVVGRPNVGKSTLVNALVGEERVIAFDQPGTTRDAIEVPFERDGRRYTLIDTAGLRRRGKIGEAVEKFSVVKTLQAIEAANVVVLLLDASTGITEQDAHVAGYILERGRAVVVAVNKWDAADKEARERIKSELAWKLGFLGFAETHFISAQDGKGLAPLHALGRRRLRRRDGAPPDAQAHRALIAAVERQAPPRPAASARSCATPTRAASIRRSSSSTATRSTTCPSPTSATWRGFSATRSSSRARRCASSSAPGAIPTPARSADSRIGKTRHDNAVHGDSVNYVTRANWIPK